MKHSDDLVHGETIEQLLASVSPRSRRIWALGIRGAADDNPNAELEALLARATAEAMAELSDEDLSTLLDELRAAGVNLLSEGDASDEVNALGERVVEAIAAVTGAQGEREELAVQEAEAQAARETRAAELLAQVNGTAEDEPETDPAGGDPAAGDPDPDAPVVDGDPDPDAPAAADPPATDPPAAPLAASGAVTRVATRRPARNQPAAATADVHTVLRASANCEGVRFGTLLDTPQAFFRAIDPAVRASVGYAGPFQKVAIAQLGAYDASEVYGAERMLRRDSQANEAAIYAMTSQAALRASGGICAPPPIQYDLPTIGDDSRPVRDALARFGADRGGVRLLPAVTITDVAGSVGIWTEENDQDPSDPATKVCATLDCPDEVETLVDAITRCLKIGNFRQRYFPEQVMAWTQQVGVLWARTAETKLLTAIGAGSTQVTAGENVLGATRVVLRTMERLVASVRSRNRLPDTFPIRLIGPQWLPHLLAADLSAEAPGATAERLAVSVAEIEAFFTVRNINVTWSPDGETGQIFGAQGDAPLIGWPSQVILYAFPEGSWLYLDGGTLDFGLVRDSTLNATNDFQLFSEGFENVAFHGVESHRLKLDICPNGTTSQPVDISALCADHS